MTQTPEESNLNKPIEGSIYNLSLWYCHTHLGGFEEDVIHLTRSLSFLMGFTPREITTIVKLDLDGDGTPDLIETSSGNIAVNLRDLSEEESRGLREILDCLAIWKNLYGRDINESGGDREPELVTGGMNPWGSTGDWEDDTDSDNCIEQEGCGDTTGGVILKNLLLDILGSYSMLHKYKGNGVFVMRDFNEEVLGLPEDSNASFTEYWGYVSTIATLLDCGEDWVIVDDESAKELLAGTIFDLLDLRESIIRRQLLTNYGWN